MSRRRAIPVAVALLLVLMGCGSDDPVVTQREDSIPARTPVTTSPAEEFVEDGAPPETEPQIFGIDEVVRFEAGATSATIADAVIRGQRNRYTLGAAAGQTMNVGVTSLEDNAVFDIRGPLGDLLATEATTASVVLPTDGDYTVIVGGTRGNASYELTVEIPVG